MKKSIAVFCGSNSGGSPVYAEAAAQLGAAIALSGRELVYGGACVGLMGVVADNALKNGGRVIGVLPESLRRKELVHEGLSDLHIVAGMHERKAMMAELSEAFIALPGGYGTFDEIFDILTCAQVGLHEKPLLLLNVSSYFDRLLDFLAHCVGEGFLASAHFKMLLHTENPLSALEMLDNFKSEKSSKWLE
jgi:uncharacterized protein (TIGR00730 family)